ncbi:MAG TPA: VOC family protein [Nocardioides sp.]|nr:VOC family protein [Nocardioides sp.]
MVALTLGDLLVADPPDAWRQAGFAVDDDGCCDVGTVRIRLIGRDAGKGVVAWCLRGTTPAPAELDGIPTTVDPAGEPPRPAAPAQHANGTQLIDHVVVLTPDLARTCAALAEVGMEPRRERDGELGGTPMRQVFYRMGEVILEVVGPPGSAGEGPAQVWGITFTVADIDATAAALGEHVGRVKDAVQPGRRITTLRRSAGLSVPVAFISPQPPRASRDAESGR